MVPPDLSSQVPGVLLTLELTINYFEQQSKLWLPFLVRFVFILFVLNNWVPVRRVFLERRGEEGTAPGQCEGLWQELAIGHRADRRAWFGQCSEGTGQAQGKARLFIFLLFVLI